MICGRQGMIQCVYSFIYRDKDKNEEENESKLIHSK